MLNFASGLRLQPAVRNDKTVDIMTRELLNRVAKDAKINLNWYTHVYAWINPNYTKLFIEFSTIEICGHSRHFCCAKSVTKSVAAISRRNALRGEADAWEYTTNGHEWISDIK